MRLKTSNQVRGILFGLFWMLALACWTPLLAERRAISAGQSTLKILVDKAGLFSFLAHDHVISAVTRGEVETQGNLSVELLVQAAQLKVEDPELAAEKRAEVHKTMLGPQVLDVERFPEIRFKSEVVRPTGSNRWIVQGSLSLHGRQKPVTVEVAEEDGHYRGSATLKQTDFGMSPVSLAGGTVKVKDKITIQFDVVLE